MNLLELVTSECNRHIIDQELERIDETIRFTLDSARKYTEGIQKKCAINKT